MLAQIDIEDLIQRCRSANARAYVKEAVDCYRIGAYRACVITTWIAVVYDFIDKLRELALAGDTAATKLVTEFDEIQRKRDTEAALKFERDVLAIAKDNFELITVQEKADLDRLVEDRNRCGHPNLNRDNEVYTPPPELARLHLRVAIEHVLSRPPVQGKAALTMLQQTVDSDYFPTTVVEAEKVLASTPLPRAKKNVVRDFILGGLISLMREVLPEKKMWQRLAAVQVAQMVHPETAKTALQEKFDDVAFRTPDANFIRFVWLLAANPDLQPLLKEATWVKLQNYVQALPTAEFGGITNALVIPQLHRAAVERIRVATRDEVSAVVPRLVAKPDDAFIDRCIELYGQAGSFNAANAMANQMINPLIGYFNQDQARRVILAGKNYEVEESAQFPSLAYNIKSAGKLSDSELSAAINEAGLQQRLGHLLTTAPAPPPPLPSATTGQP